MPAAYLKSRDLRFEMGSGPGKVDVSLTYLFNQLGNLAFPQELGDPRSEGPDGAGGAPWGTSGCLREAGSEPAAVTPPPTPPGAEFSPGGQLGPQSREWPLRELQRVRLRVASPSSHLLHLVSPGGLPSAMAARAPLTRAPASTPEAAAGCGVTGNGRRRPRFYSLPRAHPAGGLSLPGDRQLALDPNEMTPSSVKPKEQPGAGSIAHQPRSPWGPQRPPQREGERGDQPPAAAASLPWRDRPEPGACFSLRL